MLIIAKGKNVDVTPSLRALAQEKMSKLARHVPDIRLAEVEFSVEHTRSVSDRYVAQVTMELAGHVLRAEERAGDMRAALDAVAGEIERQLEHYRSRQRGHVRGRTQAERFVVAEAGPTGGEYGSVIPAKPTAAEEEREEPGGA